MAHTLRLVPPPLLWIVVGAHSEASKAAGLLRETGIMYRHLTFKENFTDPNAENDHQRNVALNHVEKHRLDGIVHFAGMFNTYDLQFFEEIRDIMMLRWWPAVEGLIGESSNVLGRQSKDLADILSGLAFNSSILWNTERQTHPPSQLPEITQCHARRYIGSHARAFSSSENIISSMKIIVKRKEMGLLMDALRGYEGRKLLDYRKFILL